MNKSIVWFRRDLRLADNPALVAAHMSGASLILLYIHSPEEEGAWSIGAASRWWLHESLHALMRDIAARGGQLILRRGSSSAILRTLIAETGACALYLNRLYEPLLSARDQLIESEMQERGVAFHAFNGSLLIEPARVKNRQNGPYKVFTPFYKRVTEELAVPYPLKAPGNFSINCQLESFSLDSLELHPRMAWSKGLAASWQPGEAGAQRLLACFVAKKEELYSERRDIPSEEGTSRLSPHLHFGELCVGQIWHSLSSDAECYRRQLIWREFAYHLLWHFPHSANQDLQGDFANFPWVVDPIALRAWEQGVTGYPIVDAGMRELWSTGWMHNRVRMIVASFLTKHLLIHWKAGAAWFWDTLVDADLANNTMGWQWIAGMGADAAPYFRIFNPELQSKRFDPQGCYIRRWLPELVGLSNRWIHEPWKAPASQRIQGYPLPIVDHTWARNRALEAYRLR